MKIKKLSQELQSSLRTGISILDVTHCVSELVQNSLDAKATSIAVRINLENFNLQVVDNGQGLNKDELDVIGQRYMTSKCRSINDLKRNLPYYGFRGESLASIIEACSVLMMVSKAEGCKETYSKVFRGSKESNIAAASAHNRLCTGTTVVIKGFLQNLPVRRARIQPAIELESVRHCLIALSIINYKVSFTLRNDVTKLVILQTQEFSSFEDAINFHCNLKENHALMTVPLKKNPFKISAYISKETEPSGNFQFIYVNGRLVKNKRIYELVNKHLSKSFSMRNIGKEVKGNDDKPKEKSSPVFIVHIQCPFSEYDLVGDPKKVKVEFKRWDFLDEILKNIVDRFVLSDNSFYMSDEKNDSKQEDHLLGASNIASHNDHVVKSNVLCGKSVTRPIPVSDITENKHTVETNNAINKKSKTVKELEDETIENEDMSECDNDACEVISKEIEKENDKIIHPCPQQETSFSKGNSSNKKSMADDKLTKDNSGIRKAKHTIACAETKPAVCNREETKGVLHNKYVSLYSKTRLNQPNDQTEDCHVKSNFKSPAPFKVPKPTNTQVKRKHFTEHILTESESDGPPSKKACPLNKIGLQNNKDSRTSVLPNLMNNRSFKTPYLTEHILTESESSLSFKDPRAKSFPFKKKIVTEHILTESESEICSTKLKTSSIPPDYQENNQDKKSILPIILHDFFNDAVNSMFQSQNIYYSLIEDMSIRRPIKTLQVELSRSLKKISNKKALRFNQKHILKYLDNKKKGYITCSKESSSFHDSKEICSTKLGSDIQNPNVMKSDEISKEVLTADILNHSWKPFSPVFANDKTNNKAMFSHNRCKSGLTFLKTSTEPFDQIQCVGNPLNDKKKGYDNNFKFSTKTKYLRMANKPNGRSTLKLSNCVYDKDKIHQSKNAKKKKKSLSESKTEQAGIHKTQFHLNQTNKTEWESNHCRKKYFLQSNGCKKDKLGFNLNNVINEENKVHFKEFSGIFEKSQGFQFENNCLTTNTFFTLPNSSPNVTCYTEKDSDCTNYAPDETWLHTCFDLSKYVPFMTKNKNIHLSPTPSIFKLNSHNSFNPQQTYCTESPSLHLKLNKNLNNKSIDNNAFLINSPDNSYTSNDPLSNNNVPGIRYFQPVKDAEEKRHERKTFESNNLMPGVYNSKQFRRTQHFLAGDPKYFSTTLKHKENNCNFNLFTAFDKVRHSQSAGKTFGLTINDNNKPHANNTSHTYFLCDGTRSIDCVEQIPFEPKQTYDDLHISGTENKSLDNVNEWICPTNFIDISNNVPPLHQENSFESGDVVCSVTKSSIDENEVIALHTPIEDSIKKSPSKNDLETCEQISKCTNKTWNKEITLSGKVFYINQLTGMSSFTTPIFNESDKKFVLENRHWFMPKGVSPIVNANGDLKSNTRLLSEAEKCFVESIVNANNVELARVKWRDEFLNHNQGTNRVLHILNENENCGDWTLPSIDFKKSCVFSTKSLSSAQILGQVDRKFIAALLQPNKETNMVLVLFDQHAVDERIQLESLVAGYKTDDGLETHVINYTIEITLSETETTILKDNLGRISKLGLSLIVQENKALVNKVPICLFNRYTRENENKEWLGNMVTALVKHLVSSVQDGCGVMPSMPPLLYEIISTEACRGSIKFGDVLTLDLCRLLVSKLALCETPFQCAHGRPVLTPLIELKPVKHTVEAITLKKLAQRAHSKNIKTVGSI